MIIRRAEVSDIDGIWRIFRAVVAPGDTYTFAPDTSRDEAGEYFLGGGIVSFVAEREGRIVGMYKLIPNRRDRGAHVANASFMVDPAESGRGIGRQLGVHCLREARARGYLAMQFNFVVSTNTRAVKLWQDLGFAIVGTLPNVFRHKSLGDVDAHVMYRSLEDLPWAHAPDVPRFGTKVDGRPYVVRPSAYALVTNAAGQLAVVRTVEGVLLPGGGIDPGETADATACRETLEECALEIQVSSTIGYAIDIVLSQKDATCYEKRSTFLTAAIVRALPRSPEHEVRWLAAAAAAEALTYPGHAWAVRRLLERGAGQNR